MKLFSAIICLVALICQIGAGVYMTCDSCIHHEVGASKHLEELGAPLLAEPHHCGCGHSHHQETQPQLNAQEDVADADTSEEPHQHTPCTCSDVEHDFENFVVLSLETQVISPSFPLVRLEEFSRCDEITASSAPPWLADALFPDSGGYLAIQYGAFLL